MIRADGDLLGLRYSGSDLSGGNGELAAFDVNAELLSGVDAGIVAQPTREILPSARPGQCQVDRAGKLF